MRKDNLFMVALCLYQIRHGGWLPVMKSIFQEMYREYLANAIAQNESTNIIRDNSIYQYNVYRAWKSDICKYSPDRKDIMTEAWNRMKCYDDVEIIYKSIIEKGLVV